MKPYQSLLTFASVAALVGTPVVADEILNSFERELNHQPIVYSAATGEGIDADPLYGLINEALHQDNQVLVNFGRAFDERKFDVGYVPTTPLEGLKTERYVFDKHPSAMSLPRRHFSGDLSLGTRKR